MSLQQQMTNPFAFLNRQTVRAPVNPLDKCTIVNIYPRSIEDTKYTIQPSFYKIEKGSYEEPSILVVGPASWWKELDESQPLLEIPISSITVADSFVRDYCNGIVCCNMGDCMLGLFYIPGEHTLQDVRTKYKNLLDKANLFQRNWYLALVRLADALWARTNGNPLSISDDMRLAAQELGLQKEWIRDYTHVEMVRCVACGALRNPAYPVCQTCKAIADPDAAKKLDLKFAV